MEPAELRTDATEEETAPKAGPLRSVFSVNGLAELVADVVEQTGRSPSRTSPGCAPAGMRTPWEDGLAEVAAGITSLEEPGRVLV